MPVSFQNIPAGWKVPLFWAEVDASMAGLPLLRQPALMAGIMTQEGDAEPSVPIIIGTQAQADARFGEGSEMSRMFRAFFRNNFANEVWGVGVPEPAGGTRATAIVTVDAVAQEAGTIHLYIGADHVPVNIGASDTEDDIAQAIADAINDNGHLPVIAEGPRSPLTIPANLTAPTLTGAPVEGGDLTTSNGTWTNSPASYTYRWLHEGPPEDPIAGATAATYTLVLADVGEKVLSEVTAINAAGNGVAKSAATDFVDPLLQAPTIITPPVITEVTQRSARATSDPGEVWITCKWRGVSGNEIRIGMNLFGRVGGQVSPPGLVLTMPAALTGGQGSPDWTDAIENMGENSYEYVAMPYTDTESIRAWDEEYGFSDNGRWGWMRQLYGHVFSARRGSYSSLIAFSDPGTSLNSPVISVMGFETTSPSPAFEWAAAYTAKAQRGLVNDPARPLQTLRLLGILLAPDHERFTLREVNSLASHGIATQIPSSDNRQPMISRETTLYQYNEYGTGDDAYELVTTLATLARVLRNQRQAITSKFPRHKLANDGTRFGPGQAIVTPGIIKGELIAQYVIDEFNGLVEDTRAFKRHLLVERDPNDPNRVNVVYPPDLINQLRLFAVLCQFRLQYDRGIDEEVSIGALNVGTGIAA